MEPDDDHPVSRRALARTYNHRSYADPWACVVDYRDTVEHAAAHPDAGWTAIGRALGLPPSRVRGWLDDTKPDPVRGIERADERGWLDCALDEDDRRMRGFNVLVAWVLSGGSVNETHTPYLVVEDDGDDRAVLDRAAGALGIDLDFTRRAEPGRSTELRPVRDASIVGRILSVLGAPVGAKGRETPIDLPWYLAAAPGRLRREFVQVYCRNRAAPRGDGLRLREGRSSAYLDRLAALFAATTGAEIGRGEDALHLPEAAAATIEEWPPVLARG